MSDLHTNGTANCAGSGAQDDIVERLDGCRVPLTVEGDGWVKLLDEAAAEIERLRILVANMADALEWCGCGDDDPDELVADTERTAAIRALIKEARRA